MLAFFLYYEPCSLALYWESNPGQPPPPRQQQQQKMAVNPEGVTELDALQVLNIVQAALNAGTIDSETYARQSTIVLRMMKECGAREAMSGTSGNVRLDCGELASALSQQQLTLNAPWRGEMLNFRESYRQLEQVALKEDIDVLRREVHDKAEASELTAGEVLALQYLLFYEGEAEAARRVLSAIILRTPRAYRNKLHNWGAIAPHMNPGDLNMYGNDIADLNYPLFPPASCRMVNSKVFMANQRQFYGGSTGSDTVGSLYCDGEKGMGSPAMKGGSIHPKGGDERELLTAMEKQLTQLLGRVPTQAPAAQTPNRQQPAPQGQKPKTVWVGGAQGEASPKNA